MRTAKELRIEEMNMVNAGKKVTAEEVRKSLKDDETALGLFNFVDKVHKWLDGFGFKHDYNLEIHE